MVNLPCKILDRYGKQSWNTWDFAPMRTAITGDFLINFDIIYLGFESDDKQVSFWILFSICQNCNLFNELCLPSSWSFE